METLKLRNINLKGGYKIELLENEKNQLLGKSSRLLSSGKNKGSYKVMEFFRFPTEERRNEWIKRVVDQVQKRVNTQENEKEALKEARENMNHGFNVGDVLYSSWGYDQTNVDFYQIVESSKKSIKIRSIGAEMIPNTHGHDYANVKPVLNDFNSEPETKIVQVRLKYSTKESYYYVNGRFSSLSKYDSGEKGVYCSWGR